MQPGLAMGKTMNDSNLDKVLIFFDITLSEATKSFKEMAVEECCFNDVPDDMFEEMMATHTTLQDMQIDHGTIMAVSSDSIPFKKEPRLYFLIDGRTVVYIGQTMDLCARIGAHLRHKEFDKAATFIVDRREINDREDVNIMAYKPQYNKQIKTNHEYFRMVMANGVFE